MTELRIRVKDVIKSRLEELKKETGLSINYYVNYAIVKQLVMDKIIKYWELDDKPDPHYETINKLPEDMIDYSDVHDKPTKPLVYANQDMDDLKVPESIKCEDCTYAREYSGKWCTDIIGTCLHFEKFDPRGDKC